MRRELEVVREAFTNDMGLASQPLSDDIPRDGVRKGNGIRLAVRSKKPCLQGKGEVSLITVRN